MNVPISEFKAKCITLLKQVYASGEPIVVTLRGRLPVRIEPWQERSHERRLGALAGTATYSDDIIGYDGSADWEAG